jgi:hypothetical protein
MSVHSIFLKSPPISSAEIRKNRVVAGFTQVFAAILSRQLRTTTMGDGQGPLGTAGGTPGDVYGAFLDEAMGHALATSPAMKPLNRAIGRELERPIHSVAGRDAIPNSTETKSDRGSVVGSIPDMVHDSMMAQNRTGLELDSDSRGPVLLPPEPGEVASVLPPPPRLEG